MVAQAGDLCHQERRFRLLSRKEAGWYSDDEA
jgi:hypothetical protein